MQAGRNKLFLTLHNKPVLAYTAGAFQKSSLVDGILVVAKDGELEQVQQMLPQNVYDKIIGYTISNED